MAHLLFVPAYSADAVYLYSTADEPTPEDAPSPSPSPVLSSNAKRRKLDESDITNIPVEPDETDLMDLDIEQMASLSDNRMDSDDSAEHNSRTQSSDSHDTDIDEADDEDGYIEFMDSVELDEADLQPHVPVVMPRRRFAGARNVDTIKDGEYTRLVGCWAFD